MTIHPVDLAHLSGADGLVGPLNRRETFEAFGLWHRQFAVEIGGQPRGRWSQSNAWTIFTLEKTAAKTGVRAFEAYLAAAAEGIVVIPAESGYAALRLERHARPDYRGLHVDRYVMETEGAWTMVFSHEEFLGPWFREERRREPSEGG